MEEWPTLNKWHNLHGAEMMARLPNMASAATSIRQTSIKQQWFPFVFYAINYCYVRDRHFLKILTNVPDLQAEWRVRDFNFSMPETKTLIRPMN
jgi:hypothetical protein